MNLRPAREMAAALSIAIMVIFAAAGARCASGGPVASRAFGQLDLVHNGVNIINNVGLWNPQAVAVDRSVTPNRLYVADAGNHRVLAWHSIAALTSGSSADLVIGQADFLSWQAQCNNAAVTASTLCVPAGVAVDAAGNLYVADFGNNRVLEYDSPFDTDTQPDLVFGQSGSFTSTDCNQGGVSAGSLCGASAVAVDSEGNVYIADTTNSRVLEFALPTVTGVTRAGLVFGQHGSFSSAVCNLGGVSANSLCRPSALAVDRGGNLYVGDHDNYRVLEYGTPPGAHNTTAALVFGQNNSFVSDVNSCQAGASASGLCTPDGLTVDDLGNLYITGSSFSRVLEYNAPLSTGHTLPDAVIGQSGFAASGCNQGGLGPAGLCAPFGAAIDSAGNLFVADFANNRVVQYHQPPPGPGATTSANLALGQIALNQNGPNVTKPDGLYWPAAVVIDSNSSPNHIYLADTNNSRVLGWFSVPNFKYAGPPDLVIGQPGTMTGGCNQNRTGAAGNSLPAANTLCQPDGLAVDAKGNLYVADSGNFRVLEYNAPFGSGKSANLAANVVFGQSRSFITRVENKGGVSATSMSQPGGLATDPSGNLYVSDPVNNRVLEYDHPASGDTTAAAVFGQGGSFAGNACNFNGHCTRVACFTNADALCAPGAVAVDNAGRLFIADSANNRVLIFDHPGAPAKAADIVIGQADFRGLSCGTLCNPKGVTVDGAGGLFAANTGKSVVNRYRAPLRTAMAPEAVIGRPLCDQAIANDDTFCRVSGLAFDPTGLLYASDTINNRVLAFDLAATPTITASSTPTMSPRPTSTPTPMGSPTPAPGQPSIGAIPAVIRAGADFTIDGSGFTHGSKVNFFVATAAGAINSGPVTPSAFAATKLTVPVAADIPLGQGVVTVQVVNTDRGYLSSNVVSALLQGNPAAGIPSITGINSVPLAPDSIDPNIAVANVETVVVQGTRVTLAGGGFDTANGVAVDLFCACPGGKVGPFFLAPGNPGLTATSVRFPLPAAGPNTPLDGPGSFVVSNRGSDASFSRKSNAVAAPIGHQITVTAVSQSGAVIAVSGTGFSILTVVNLFNGQGAGIVNLGGFKPDGTPRIPLTFIDNTQFSFTLPGAAIAGPGYVQALNPPFVPFSSSGNGAGGAFTIW